MKPVLASIREYVSSAPRAGEARRTIGPILAEMWAVSPPGAAPPNVVRRRQRLDDIAGVEPDDAAAGDTARLCAAMGRASVHALVYLARHRFACPGLEPYDFAASAPDGVRSPRLDCALDSLGPVGASGSMGWDTDGRFAGLVRERGGDAGWLSIAALLCMMDDAARIMGDVPGRDGLIDEACMLCGALARARMPAVYDDLCRMGLLGQGTPERGARA